MQTEELPLLAAHTHSEVMNWLIGLLFSAEVFLAGETLPGDPPQGSHEEQLKTKKMQTLESVCISKLKV